MQAHTHSLQALFAQLGLADERSAVEAFLAAHRPLPPDVALTEAPFWSPAQARFLCEEILEDADWAAVVDELNLLLR